MSGLKEILNFLLPIPPAILRRYGEFPDSAAIFDDIAKNPPNPRMLGRIFSRLCSLAGFAWLVWAFSFIVFVFGVIIFLYYWGKNLDMAAPDLFGVLSCKMLLSMFAGTLVFGKIIFIGATVLCFQLSDRCYDHINSRPPLKIKKGKKK